MMKMPKLSVELPGDEEVLKGLAQLRDNGSKCYEVDEKCCCDGMPCRECALYDEDNYRQWMKERDAVELNKIEEMVGHFMDGDGPFKKPGFTFVDEVSSEPFTQKMVEGLKKMESRPTAFRSWAVSTEPDVEMYEEIVRGDRPTKLDVPTETTYTLSNGSGEIIGRDLTKEQMVEMGYHTLVDDVDKWDSPNPSELKKPSEDYEKSCNIPINHSPIQNPEPINWSLVKAKPAPRKAPKGRPGGWSEYWDD